MYFYIYISCGTSSIFELDNVKNEAILRDSLNFSTWQHQKRSSSARLPSKMESWVLSWHPRANIFAIFPSHLSQVMRRPPESDAKPYKVLRLSRKIIFANLMIWCSKMQPFSGNQHPGLLTSLMNMFVVLRLPREMHLCGSSSNVHACHRSRFAHLWQGAESLALATQNERFVNMWSSKCAWRRNGMHFFDIWIWTSKSLRSWGALYILTSKCASHHNGVDISTSKSVPNLLVLSTFGFQTCFRSQRRALFRHLNFQKWFEPVSF